MPLRIVLYPNNEIACHATLHRAVAQREAREERQSLVSLPLLDIKHKLEQRSPDAIAPPRDLPKPGYGAIPKGAVFGLRARRRVRRLAGVFDHLNGSNLFITLTLPGSTKESFQALSAYSSEVIHRYKVWLCQQAKRFGVEQLKYLYVWELQKRGALHLHLVVNCPTDEFRSAIEGSYHSRWFKLLKSLSEKIDVDLFRKDDFTSHLGNSAVWQSDCQLIDGFIGAYLGKYLSKGSEDQNDSDEQIFFPTRWWGASQGVRDSLSELSVSFHCDGNVQDLCSLVDDIKREFPSGILRDCEYDLKFRLGLGRVLFIDSSIYRAMGDYIQAISESRFAQVKRGSVNRNVASRMIAELIEKVKNIKWGNYAELDAKNREILGGVVRGDVLAGGEYFRLWRTLADNCWRPVIG